MKPQAIPARRPLTLSEIIAREAQIQLRNGAMFDDVVDFTHRVTQQLGGQNEDHRKIENRFLA